MPRRLLTLLLPFVLLALTGCFADSGPRLSSDVELTERWRMPNPVPADGRWHFTDGPLIGEGRRLASVDLRDGKLSWAVDLPAGYAITGAHPVFRVGPAVILAGDDEVRALAAANGSTLWERKLTAHAELAHDDQRLITAAGGELAGFGVADGKPLWTRRLTERVTLHAGGAYCACVYLLGARTISRVSTVDGRTTWELPRPPGATPLLFPLVDRLVVVIPPAAPACRGTFRGVAIGVEVWRLDVPWRDAGRAAAPCTFDPARIVDSGFELGLPGAGVLGPLGVLRAEPLDAGEYLLGDDSAELTWTPGVGYRSRRYRDRGVASVPPPDDGKPWATQVESLWLLRSGSGLALYNPYEHDVRWKYPKNTPTLTDVENRLVYLDGPDLVAIGPPPL
ncbi:PQQ-binding-like beta-propeller repeat protein [Actinoplanes sp. L3-i22]|uniref:outer membrane protein assembly factor BamB family protein n=1 Tax=Actinoplanes sp. L3-i22 TaxID=2836373 RepID=UPI001C78FF1D|nr:PQQ-binding-like beta-propeller repeat protein [Actinoplanes sp. L3-i22]BCY13021.1 hypothetical protein L3i22_081090 [Actinoplanes sp. L3-i22]